MRKFIKKHIKKIAIAISVTIFGLGTLKFTKDKTETTLEYNVKKDRVAVDGVFVFSDTGMVKLDSTIK